MMNSSGRKLDQGSFKVRKVEGQILHEDVIDISLRELRTFRQSQNHKEQNGDQQSQID